MTFAADLDFSLPPSLSLASTWIRGKGTALHAQELEGALLEVFVRLFQAGQKFR